MVNKTFNRYNLVLLCFLFLDENIEGQIASTSLLYDDTSYINPIIHADYSDPDVIRVGEDYYMVSSSFSHFPGLPILHSNDLVHWQIVGHAALTYPDEAFIRPQHGDAIWAPSIRYHNDEFYIYFGDPDRGVFMTKTKDPRGKWAPLRLVKKVTGWIDCCPFWDDNGKAYLVHAFANSRVGLKSVLMMNEMSPDGLEIIGTSTLVFNGQQAHNTMEGPKLYKRNGYYYIFAPAGGVSTGWQTVLRSKNIFGPYEDKIVLEQGSTTINGPHQGAWITTVSGSDWFIHFQDKAAYGRVVHLQPMEWIYDWPSIGKDYNGNGIGEPMLTYNIPIANKNEEFSRIQTSDQFDSRKPGLQWQWQANPQPNWIDTLGASNQLTLRLVPRVASTNLWMQPNLLLQKFSNENFNACTKLVLNANEIGDKVGLIIFGLDYAYIGIEKESDQLFKLHVSSCKEANQSKYEVLDESIAVNVPNVYLSVEIRAEYEKDKITPLARCIFKYSLDGKTYKQLGGTFTAREGKWVGAKLGLMAIGSPNSFASIDWFNVIELAQQ